MINLFLATALSLNASLAATAADTAKTRIPLRSMPAAGATQDTMARPLPFGDDKLQHAFISYAVYSFSYGGARAAKVGRKASLTDAAATVAVIGIGKELWDASHHKRFSVADLLADAVGATAGYAMMKNVR